MKKIILPIASLLFFGGFISAQVGINTPTPKTTMDVGAKRDSSGNITDNNQLLGLQAPRLTRGELTANTAPYGTDQKGALVYITDISTGNTTGSRINMDTVGYYYFDGTLWQKISGGPGAVNIYTSDGTLGTNRTVAMADKTLSFTSAATAGTNHFNIDGATFSVNTFSNRIGMGTTTPSAILNTLNPTAGDTGDVLATGISNCGADCGQGTARNMVIYNTNSTSFSAGSIDFVAATASTGISAATIKGIDRNIGSNFGGLSFQTRGDASGLTDRLVIKSTGNVGIGTTDIPTQKLDVNGNARIRNLTDANASASYPRTVVSQTDGTLGYVEQAVTLKKQVYVADVADQAKTVLLDKFEFRLRDLGNGTSIPEFRLTANPGAGISVFYHIDEKWNSATNNLDSNNVTGISGRRRFITLEHPITTANWNIWSPFNGVAANISNQARNMDEFSATNIAIQYANDPTVYVIDFKIIDIPNSPETYSILVQKY